MPAEWEYRVSDLSLDGETRRISGVVMPYNRRCDDAVRGRTF